MERNKEGAEEGSGESMCDVEIFMVIKREFGFDVYCWVLRRKCGLGWVDGRFVVVSGLVGWGFIFSRIVFFC